VHAPVPSEHGFTPSETIERARIAVESRVHPLFAYDPSSDGVFGVRATIEGNPKIDEVSGGSSLFDWALGEARFKSAFTKASADENMIAVDKYFALAEAERVGKTPTTEDPATGETLMIRDSLVRGAEKRQQIWKIYREITGKESPFVEQIRSDLRQQVEVEQRQSVETMKKEYETRIDEMQHDINGKMATQLRKRLLSLAGFAPDTPQSGKE
jgi:pyruvate-ferredoxin/flavodoxin oxidoreductase